uniref:Annexin n=1 Tax=Canis lupus familiaris TaxID=9615 RepID=A0A8C0PFM7_CANLF
MQGARCRTLSRVSRITPWAEGGAKPLRHPGWAVHLFILTTDYSSKLSFIKGLGLVCKIGSDPGRGFEISYRGCQRAACITERAMEEVTTDPFCLLRNTLGKWSSKLHPFSIPRSLPPCPWAQGPSRLARSEPARAATQQLRPPFLRPRREEEPQGPTARSPARSPHALPAALWRQRPLRLPGGGRTPAARPRTRGAPRRRTEAGEGAGRARGAGRGVRGRGAAGGRRFRCSQGARSRCPEPLLLASPARLPARLGALRSRCTLGLASPCLDPSSRHGTGTDEESILTLLTSRSNAQRQEIAAAFKTLFGRDLLDDLKSELTGKFEKLIVALMKPSRLYDAYELKHALKGAGTNEKVLTEIIASRTPEELRAIKQVYEEEYGSSLEDDVVGDTSGYYQRMLVVLLQANRDPDAGIDEAQVEQDAQALFQAGELKWGTDEEKFITIFGTRSVSHLRRVKSIRSIPAYLAETLYYAMKGAGTDDHTLIRVVVSRSEIDLFNIRKEFRKNFATSLYSMIKGDTSGDYKKALLMLCGGEDD